MSPEEVAKEFGMRLIYWCDICGEGCGHADEVYATKNEREVNKLTNEVYICMKKNLTEGSVRAALEGQ